MFLFWKCMHIATYLKIMLPIICRVSRSYQKKKKILQKQTQGLLQAHVHKAKDVVKKAFF